MPVYKDNREFIDALEAAGQLVRIKQEVDWDIEAGAIVRKACEDGAPAPLMENIKDYPGTKFLGGPLASYKRLAIALGLDPDSNFKEIAAEYNKRTSGNGIPPVMVDRSQAPVKQNIMMGKDVDLLKLPAPMVHDGDGNRYLCTWHFVCTKDPDTGDVNWGTYRQGVYDEKTMVGPLLPFSDGGKMFHGKYVPRGEPMPFATVMAADPLSILASSAPASIPETDFAGMLLGQPVELVKCETNDLEVPANAEVVIEGVVLPDVRLEEAPFGEYTGYRTSPREPRMVYKVNCVTYRDNPINLISCPGVPTDENQLLRGFTLALELEKLLRSQGLPITGVYMPPQSTHHWMVVGVKPAYTGIAQQIAQLAYGSKLGVWFHMITVVDDTVDFTNLNEIVHAMSTRCHPVNGIHIWEGAGTPLNPFASLAERQLGRGPKVLFDCLFPLNWDPLNEKPQLISFKTAYPKAIQEKVLANWASYGYK